MKHAKFSNLILKMVAAPTLILITIMCLLIVKFECEEKQTAFNQQNDLVLLQLIPTIRFALETRENDLIEDAFLRATKNFDIEEIILFDNHGLLYKEGNLNNISIDNYSKLAKKDNSIYIKQIQYQSLDRKKNKNSNIFLVAKFSKKNLIFQYYKVFLYYLVLWLISALIIFTLSLLMAKKLEFSLKKLKFFTKESINNYQNLAVHDFKYMEFQYIADLILRQRKKYLALKNKNETIIKSLKTQNKQKTAEIRKKLESTENLLYKLENKMKNQSNFIASLSHEIKTPITSILGYIDIIKDSSSPKNQKDNIQILKKLAQDLLNMVNEILLFSKIEAGKFKTDFIPMDIISLLDDITASITPSVHHKKIDFVTIVDANVPIKILGDPIHLKQILLNFLSNAIKFTDHGFVQVHIGLDQRNTSSKITGDHFLIHFTVTDTGIGLTTEEQQQLFTEYNQVHSIQTKNVGGTGLGLVINNKLIEYMGGTLSFSSEKNIGTKINFTLPFKSLNNDNDQQEFFESPQNNAVLLFSENKIISNQIATIIQRLPAHVDIIHSLNEINKINELLKYRKYDIVVIDIPYQTDISDFIDILKLSKHNVIFTYYKQHEQNRSFFDYSKFVWIAKPIRIKKFLYTIADQIKALPNHNQNNLSNLLPKILIAEDDLITQSILKFIFKNFEVEVDCVATSEEVFEKLDECLYDMIFLDQNLADSSGTSIARKIRTSIVSHSLVPIVIMSADQSINIIKKNNDLDKIHFIDKPISHEKIQFLFKQYIINNNTNIFNPEKKPSFMMNDDEFKRLIEKELTDFFHGIKNAIEHNEIKTLKSNLHKLKGACSFISAHQIHAITVEFEKAIKNNQEQLYESYIADLEFEIDQFLRNLAEPN